MLRLSSHSFFVWCIALFLGLESSQAWVSHAPPRWTLSTMPLRMASTTTASTTTVAVDMNQYNLPDFETMAQEWTAVVRAASSLLPEGIYLQPRSSKTLMADTVQAVFPRLPDAGLGLELLELAGGRDDGVGITVLTGVGGAATESGLLAGDSLTQIQLRRRSSLSSADNGMQEEEQVFSVPLECLGYDATVEAIGSLPPAEAGDIWVVTAKRLRRRPKVRLQLQYPEADADNVTLELFAGENLRRALLVRGVKLNDALAARFDSGGSGDCGAEGTCATCAVSIEQGAYLLSPMGQQEGQIFANKPRWRMARRAVVGYGMQEGNLTIRVNPRQWD